MEFLTTTKQPPLSDMYMDDDDEEFSGDKFVDEFEGLPEEPFFHYLRRRYCPNSFPPYFKRDHPDDDLFMDDILGKLHRPHALEAEPDYVEEEEGIESLTKRVATEIIWRNTHLYRYIWNHEETKSVYTTVIETAACLVYFFYPQTELYRIGHSCDRDDELDAMWDQLQEVFPSDDAVWEVVTELITKNKYNWVTEEVIDDMIYQPNFKFSRFNDPSFPSFPAVAEKKKDELYKDIAKVVKDLKPPPFEPDEYTHWMMRFLRGDALDIELNIINKTFDDRIKSHTRARFHKHFHSLFHHLMIKAKCMLKEKLLNAVLPLITICEPVRHKMSRVIHVIVQVAELRRIAAGNQFIGRSHLIWAFYKLGFSLPLEFRNAIRFDVPDKNHPPYHIYIAAAKLALMSEDKTVNLVHFIFAVIYSTEIGFDGEGVTELYGDFELVKKGFEKLEDEIEPKDTVTVRPCRAVDAIIEEIAERYGN